MGEEVRGGNDSRPRAIAASSSRLAWFVIVAACTWAGLKPADVRGQTPEAGVVEYVVRITADRGAGSLRQAMIDAARKGGAARIRFDSIDGPFGEPQVIVLRSPLPPIRTALEIDGYIPDRTWRASGVTLRSAGTYRMLSVEEGGIATVRYLTLRGGRATGGGAVRNRGTLVLDSVTLLENNATGDGGAVVSTGGDVTIVNSTFSGNQATRGGAVAALSSRLSITNVTLADNHAREGNSVFSEATLLLRNSILAGGGASGVECVNRGQLDPRSSHNLMTTAVGCGEALLAEDPRLGPLGHYNGPTPTLPLDASSPAINIGSNDAAVDEHGLPLKWDQRGNGDPRDAAGITDLGAFEVQSPMALRVDRADDVDRRACSQLAGDCSLRGAWQLANAGRLGRVIVFDVDAHLEGAVLIVRDPLPPVEQELVIDGGAVPGLQLRLSRCDALPALVDIKGIELLGPDGRCPPRALPK